MAGELAPCTVLAQGLLANAAEDGGLSVVWREYSKEYVVKISEQATGGTRRLFLTVAIFRSWRDSKGFAAPGLPGRGQGYLM